MALSMLIRKWWEKEWEVWCNKWRKLNGKEWASQIQIICFKLIKLKIYQDDYKTQVAMVKKQLQETQDSQSKGDHKLTKVLQTLRAVQEEKGSLETALGQKNMELNSQNEVLLKKTEEVKQMREKVMSLELCLSGESDQKHQYEVIRMDMG